MGQGLKIGQNPKIGLKSLLLILPECSEVANFTPPFESFFSGSLPWVNPEMKLPDEGAFIFPATVSIRLDGA